MFLMLVYLMEKHLEEWMVYWMVYWMVWKLVSKMVVHWELMMGYLMEKYLR